MATDAPQTSRIAKARGQERRPGLSLTCCEFEVSMGAIIVDDSDAQICTCDKFCQRAADGI